MSRLLVIVIIAALGWQAYRYYEGHRPVPAAVEPGPGPSRPGTPIGQVGDLAFQCDGRAYCSQMTSCAEATFFIRNCPDTKMDGDNDGVPCESQWCR